MRILYTGASSSLGAAVAEPLLASGSVSECWFLVHRRKPAVASSKVRFFQADLLRDFRIPESSSWDMVVHFAAVTHSRNAEVYHKVNVEGTLRLAQLARKAGCSSFAFISSLRAMEGAGAYGESKLAAERALLSMPWKRLLILRPSEVYGAGNSEGIDRLINMAKRLHVAPMIFGKKEIRFCPIHVRDFVRVTCDLLLARRQGVEEYDLIGPEDFDGIELALRLARQYKALPLPVWWPFLKAGRHFFSEDQLPRMLVRRSAEQPAASPETLIRFPGS